MKKEKLYFLGFWWKDKSWWSRSIFISVGVLIYILAGYFIENQTIRSVVGIIFWITLYSRIGFEWTRKNAMFYRRKDSYLLRLRDKKLEFDATFISKVWLDEDGLNIQRINRVDTFPVDHLREEDVKRLLTVLEEYLPEQEVY